MKISDLETRNVINEQAEKLTDMIVNSSSKEDFSKAVEESKEAIKKSIKED